MSSGPERVKGFFTEPLRCIRRSVREEAPEPHSVPALYAAFIEFSYQYRKLLQLIFTPVLVLLVAALAFLVYETGGIKYVYSHSMYLVILLAGFILGARGGVLIGLLAGLALGPFMPIDVQTGEPQKLLNWLYRTGFFTAAGLFCGCVSDLSRRYLSYSHWFMHHDHATGLANRHALIEKLSLVTEEGALDQQALVVISLDNVVEVEAVYGPTVTDEIIRQLSNRLTERFGNDLSSYRLLNNQLGALLSAPRDDSFEYLLSHLTEDFGQPFSFKTIAVHGDIRMGFTDLAHPDVEPEHYLRMAETALLSASEKSQRWMRFTPMLDDISMRENLELLGELKTALSSNQLELHYQPKVALSTGKVRGAEALARWHHPTRGNIPPSKFIPRAEQSTLIDQLTYWVLESALIQYTRWRDQGIELNIAVNISTRNLLQEEFVDTVLGLLKTYKVPSRRLELEVTEATLILDIERTIFELSRLTDAGVVVSIDDFGTGYSSLQYLNDLPASLIKIDQSFVKRLTDASGSAHIVKAAVNMAHDLGKEVIAEGVEDNHAYEYLKGIGCDVAQGYLISRPVPAETFTDWYRSRHGYYRLP